MLFSIRRKLLASNIILGLCGFLVILLFWQIVFSIKIYSNLLLPSPLIVLKSLFQILFKLDFLLDFIYTSGRILSSFMISALIGIAFGLMMGYHISLNKISSPVIDFFRSIPGIVMFPLFIMIFGIGEMPRIWVTVFTCAPIIIVSTAYGVSSSCKTRKKLFKIYNLNSITAFRKVIIQDASPYIFNGMKLALSFAIILIIVTEMMLGSDFGMGRLIIESQYRFDTHIMFSIIIILGVLGSVLNIIFDRAEKKLFHWR